MPLIKKNTLDNKLVFLISLISMEVSFMAIPGETGVDGGNTSIAIVKFLILTAASLVTWMFFFKSTGQVNVLKKSQLFFMAYLLSGLFSLLFNLIHEPPPVNGFFRLTVLSFLIIFITTFSQLSFHTGASLVLISKLAPILIIVILWAIDDSLVYRHIFEDGILSDKKRLGGDIIPPNTLGGMLGVSIIITLYFLKDKWLLFMPLAIFLFGMLLLTGSRAALGSLFASVFISFATSSRSFFLNSVLKILFILTILVLTFLVFIFDIETIIGHNAYTLSGRTILWNEAIDYFTPKIDFLKIIFGFGFALSNHFIEFSSLYTNSLHNGYMQVFFGTGAIGVFFYFSILINLYKKIRKNFSHQYVFSSQKILKSLFIFLALFNVTELSFFVMMNSMTLAVLMFFCRRHIDLI